ncbi:chemotaxis protein CheW [Acetivibrio straminisolvens]|uniref:Positive regulator of CheA protein activity n=1 Tax=Acetivibrio straminisolvens JCM 21531 TaxID=1294263 RepID=W4V5J4_9FIRM|nr:chemotaxis protein CheW [Acetivibrio straminisolvens]GAE88422.1 positive regulator of CheA protein activity [Acetivibrio straminisolvens JCM 21531]
MPDIQDAVLELDEDTQKDKYLTFLLGNEEYGVGINYVTEIVGIQKIVEVPEMQRHIKGVINLRGKVIPVIDVRLMLGLEEKEYNDRTCTVVLNIRGVSVGLIVDAVAEVLQISEENIVPPPEINGERKQKYINGIGKTESGIKLLVDCERLLTGNTLESVLANIEH